MTDTSFASWRYDSDAWYLIGLLCSLPAFADSEFVDIGRAALGDRPGDGGAGSDSGGPSGSGNGAGTVDIEPRYQTQRVIRWTRT